MLTTIHIEPLNICGCVSTLNRVVTNPSPEKPATEPKNNVKIKEKLNMAIFTKYSLRLVKEESKRYECVNSCSSPENVVDILNTVHELKDQAEEVLVLLCLNTKNKVIGNFEGSRGSIDRAMFHPWKM